MNVLSLKLDFKRLGSVSFSLALGTGHVEIAEELHLHFFVAIAHAASASACSTVEGKITRSEGTRESVGRFGEELPDRFKDARVNSRGRSRRPCKRRLVHHHDFANMAGAAQGLAGTDLEFASGEPKRFHEIAVKNRMDQRRFSRTRHARDTAEDSEGYLDIDLLEIVLRRPLDRDPALWVAALLRNRNGKSPGEVL